MVKAPARPLLAGPAHPYRIKVIRAAAKAGMMELAIPTTTETETSEADQFESVLIDRFREHHGMRPFANMTRPS